MRLVHIVEDPESVSPRVDCIISNDFIAANIDISLYFGFLFTQISLSFLRTTTEGKEGVLPCSSAGNTYAVP